MPLATGIDGRNDDSLIAPESTQKVNETNPKAVNILSDHHRASID